MFRIMIILALRFKVRISVLLAICTLRLTHDTAGRVYSISLLKTLYNLKNFHQISYSLLISKVVNPKASNEA